MIKTITQITLHAQDDSPIFGESRIHVTCTDEAAGLFFDIKSDTGQIQLDYKELVQILEVATELKNQFPDDVVISVV